MTDWRYFIVHVEEHKVFYLMLPTFEIAWEAVINQGYFSYNFRHDIVTPDPTALYIEYNQNLKLTENIKRLKTLAKCNLYNYWKNSSSAFYIPTDMRPTLKKLIKFNKGNYNERYK